MYAIIEIGGKQYRIEKDIILSIDKLKNNENPSIDKVLLYVDDNNVMIGQPYLTNVSVDAEVLGTVKGRKVRGIKFKKRKNYTRTLGHRQQYLQLKINNLSLK